MRLFGNHAVPAAILAAAALSLAPAVHAAKNEPPQWALDALKIPTPAYAGDAPSVVLYDEYVETIDAQGRATERERTAVRILKPQPSRGNCFISYDVDQKINYFRAWTVTAAGKQFEAKNTDFVEVGDTSIPIMLSTEKTRILLAPASDVGSTVFCESEELQASYDQEKIWHIQSRLPFVHKALELDLPPGRNYAANWHRYAPVAPKEVAPNHWRWELDDVQALDLRDVRSAPSWIALAARMSVTWGDAAVAGKDNEWRAFGELCTRLQEHRPDPTPEITAEAHELTAGAPDFYTKLKNITQYIQENIQYFIVERGIGGWQSHYAGDIFRNRYGDCKDKATLLISLLQAVGIQAFYVPLDDRRGVVDPDDPSFAGNHMIAAIRIPADVNDSRLLAIAKASDGTRYLFFDPTNEQTPVGNLPDYEQGSYGILADGSASQLLALPVLPPQANGQDRQGAFTLAADGALTGKVEIASIGPQGADERLRLKHTDADRQRSDLEKTVAGDLPGMTLVDFRFTNPPDLNQPLQLSYDVTVPQFAHQAGPLLLVRPRPVGDDTLPFDDKPRTLPIDLQATGRWHDSFDIQLPPGYVVDELPGPVALDMDFASYHATTSVKGNTLHYEREYIVRQVELPASRAADFRKFEGTVLEDQQQAAVLKKQVNSAGPGL